jgi:D-alanyl-lipoteichoic acid acyltransferase DltB (MBOAT superfamily)
VLFNSFEFLLFLPIVFILYWFVFYKSLKFQNLLILIASYFFYGWWSYKFLGLLVLSTLLDYIYGFSVASSNPKRAKLFLWLSIINNLGILAIFKYYNFFVTQFQSAFDLIGIHVNPVLVTFALPVGISFYTFHGMSYVFDIYRGKLKPVSNVVDYALFVSFFPLLVAGPIERANHLLPQVQQKRKLNYIQTIQGLRLILWGMFKKIVIADNLAVFVDGVYKNYGRVDAFSLILGAIAFSFQIYADFSGYSDIGLGTAKLFGFELLSNFKFPYFSRDIAEFWRRWHISLSSWFKDYLYIPLGGSKGGKYQAIRNTFIIFLVSGFWHGASWNYITWGFIHACGFLPLLLLNKNRKHTSDIVASNSSLPTLKELGNILLTFSFVTIAWVFFRASNINIALVYLRNTLLSIIHNPQQFLHFNQNLYIFFYIVPFLIGDWLLRRDERNLIFTNKPIWRYVIYLLLFIALLVAGFKENSSFIYFVF